MASRVERSEGELIRNEVAAELSRRQFMRGAGSLALGAMVAAAVPVAVRAGAPAEAHAQAPLDGSLEAFFDTMIPGRVVARTELGNPVTPGAILGVDPQPGAVEADALLLAKHPRIGFETIAPPFVAELESRALANGGPFISLDYARRQRVCIGGLSFANPTRTLWEAAAAVPFTAFCAAANIPEATGRTSVGYRVMGHPGTAPRGYRNFSYRRRFARSRTRRGNLP